MLTLKRENMTDKRKYFTINEANKMIPELAKHLSRISDINKQIKFNALQTRMGAKNEIESYLIEDHVNNIRVLLNQLSKDTEAISKKGVKIKCFKKGAVQWPSVDNFGKDIWLSWELGETHISYWQKKEKNALRIPLTKLPVEAN